MESGILEYSVIQTILGGGCDWFPSRCSTKGCLKYQKTIGSKSDAYTVNRVRTTVNRVRTTCFTGWLHDVFLVNSSLSKTSTFETDHFLTVKKKYQIIVQAL